MTTTKNDETLATLIRGTLGRIRAARETLAERVIETLRAVPQGTVLSVAGRRLVVREELRCSVSQWANGHGAYEIDVWRTTVDGRLLAPSEREEQHWDGHNNHYASYGGGIRCDGVLRAADLQAVVAALPEALAQWLVRQEALAAQLELAVATLPAEEV